MQMSKLHRRTSKGESLGFPIVLKQLTAITLFLIVRFSRASSQIENISGLTS